MDQNPNTPTSNRRRNHPDDPFLLDTPPRQHTPSEASPPISFTQMLQQPLYPTSMPQQALFQGQMNPNLFAQPNPYQPNPYQANPYQANPYQFNQNMFQYTQPPNPHPPPPPQQQTQPQETESVPETQAEPTPPKRKHRKGKAKERSNTSSRISWSEAEEAALVRAWIANSEDSIHGNSQKKEAFNERVHAHFHHQMGKGIYRTVDMLTSKWRDLLKTCTKFNGIYNNLQRQWESGMKDFDVLTAALTQYRQTHNINGFAHVEAWKVMAAGPKWILQPEVLTSSGSTKRSRMSFSNDYTNISDDRTAPIDLNDDVDEDEVELTRPLGRNKAREQAKDEAKSARAKGKRAATSSQANDDGLTFFKDVFTEHLTMTKSKLEMKQALWNEQKMESDLRILSMSTEGLPDANRRAIEQAQKRIMDRMNNEEN